MVLCFKERRRLFTALEGATSSSSSTSAPNDTAFTTLMSATPSTSKKKGMLFLNYHKYLNYIMNIV